MKFFSRKPAAAHTCEHAQRATANAQARHDDHLWATQKAAQEKTDLIVRTSRHFYLWHAIVQHDFATGIKPQSHQIGMLDGLRYALAEITGLDPIVVDYRLSHGLSLVNMTECCVVDNNGTLPVILSPNSDVRLPVAERLDRLHRDALKADNHPMYHVIYGRDGATASA